MLCRIRLSPKAHCLVEGRNVTQATACFLRHAADVGYGSKRNLIMSERNGKKSGSLRNIVKAEGEEPMFRLGETVRIAERSPTGHFRAPNCIRGKPCRIEAVIEPAAINTEDEGFGRNARERCHYYRIAFRCLSFWQITGALRLMGFGSKCSRLG